MPFARLPLRAPGGPPHPIVIVGIYACQTPHTRLSAAAAQSEAGTREEKVMAIEHCCAVGEGKGIVFDHQTGVRTCTRHFRAEQRALVMELDERGAAVGLKRDTTSGGVDWPYGPNIDVPSRLAMVTWAEGLGLRRATRQQLQCVCWPTSNRRSRCDCGFGESAFGKPDEIWDHVTHWKTRRGERAVIVLQPYGVTDTGRAILDRWNAREDAYIEIRDDAWYGHGTTFIGIWNAQFAPTH
ncbi:hypothetical protein GCM10029992_38190 [Glycomyces albus]